MTINDRDFQRLMRFVREKYGINLEHKRPLIEARLSFDLSKRGYGGFTEFIDRVIFNPEGDECRHMINRLSTNFTFFFRESDYIAQLRETALPDLLARSASPLEIWSAACSSGQEAYSVAMVLEQHKRLTGAPFDYRIVGTDINTDILRAAESGVYPEAELERIPPCYRPFVTRHANQTIEISEALRRKISWRYENLLDDAPDAARYDVVFCRNVLIYFTPQLRREMTAKLHAALKPGGYLFTGTTESIDLERKYFRYIAPAFYRKAAAGR